jgi:hypothetical protein
MTDPFRSWSPAQLQQLPEPPDPLTDWDKALHHWEAFEDQPAADRLAETGTALAVHTVRLRAIVLTLERENHGLRGLVERAQRLRPYAAGALVWRAWGRDVRLLLGDDQ